MSADETCDVKALARDLWTANCECGHAARYRDAGHNCWSGECACDRDRWEALIVSDWLAEHDVEVEARVREKIAQAMEGRAWYLAASIARKGGAA